MNLLSRIPECHLPTEAESEVETQSPEPGPQQEYFVINADENCNLLYKNIKIRTNFKNRGFYDPE